MGPKVTYMGLSYMGFKLTFSKEALVGKEWNTKDSEKSTNNSEKSQGQLQSENEQITQKNGGWGQSCPRKGWTTPKT